MTFSPVVGDNVEAYDRAKREWRAGQVIAVPSPDGYRYLVAPRSGDGSALECNVFEMRPESAPPEPRKTLTDVARQRLDGIVQSYAPREDTRPLLEEVATARTRTARLAPDERQATRHAFKLLEAIAPEVDSETPGRFTRALREFTVGYQFEDFGSILKTFPRGDADTGIVVVRDMPFASLCEHHVLPFTGHAHVAYLPSDRIVGLSKIPRLLRAVTRRLQVQERIGAMIADALIQHVGARGAMVVIRSQHTCMALRGVECPGSMVTSTVRGVFADDSDARSEAMRLMA